MAKEYVTRCIVKKNGKSYKKGSVIKDLTENEIKQGLAEHWLEAVGNDEDSDEKSTEKKPGKSPKKPGKSDISGLDDSLKKMTADELLAEAVRLGLQADSSMSEEGLRSIIKTHRLIEEAKK